MEFCYLVTADWWHHGGFQWILYHGCVQFLPRTGRKANLILSETAAFCKGTLFWKDKGWCQLLFTECQWYVLHFSISFDCQRPKCYALHFTGKGVEFWKCPSISCNFWKISAHRLSRLRTESVSLSLSLFNILGPIIQQENGTIWLNWKDWGEIIFRDWDYLCHYLRQVHWRNYNNFTSQ